MIPQSEYIREEHVILSLQNNLGNLGLVGADLGLGRYELLGYLARHPEVKAVYDTLRESLREARKDAAEDMLFERMDSSDTLLMFFLRTQAKDRGYDTSKGSVVNNKVEVNVDARSLIAAMRTGANLVDAEEVIDAEGEVFQLTELLTDAE